MNNHKIIFATQDYQYLQKEIIEDGSYQKGIIITKQFPDGEIYHQIETQVLQQSVVLIGGTIDDKNTLELYDLAHGIIQAGAKSLLIIIPYFGYARQDRKDKPRVAIGSKLVANILTAAGADRVITMDLHAPQIQGYFDIPVDHLDSSAIFIPYIRDLQLENLTFAAPDVGSANRIREVASYFNVEMVICDKHRKRANEIASMVVIGDVTDRDIVLIDDICDTAGTLTKAAKLLKDKGARSVRALCTHPVLSGNAYTNIENSILEELVVCDTIPLRGHSSKLKVLSVANLFASAIKNAYENQSITSLFIHSQQRNK